MNTEKMFEIAVRNKFRFPYKGLVNTEDLFDLSVRELDIVFKTLNAQAKQSQEESLLATKTKDDEILSIQIAIVKHIVSVKLAEQEAREKAVAKREQKQKIMEIIAAKQDESLHNASVEELQAMLNDLN